MRGDRPEVALGGHLIKDQKSHFLLQARIDAWKKPMRKGVLEDYNSKAVFLKSGVCYIDKIDIEVLHASHSFFYHFF